MKRRLLIIALWLAVSLSCFGELRTMMDNGTNIVVDALTTNPTEVVVMPWTRLPPQPVTAAHMTNSTTVTVLTQSVAVAIGGGDWTNGTFALHWTTATNGVITSTAAETVNVQAVGRVSIEPNLGNNQTIGIVFAIDGVAQPVGFAGTAEVDKGSPKSIAITDAFQVSPTSTVSLMVINETSTRDIVVHKASVSLK